jgi:RNA polymerase sigma-70 factor, ECF subfamily
METFAPRTMPLQTFPRAASSDTAIGPADTDLIAAIARGEADALGTLYCRHRASSFATAYTLLRDPAAAEDVVHDAFLNLWRAAGSYQARRGSPRPWLMTIVRNAALDQLRSRELANRSHHRLIHGSDASPADDPATAASDAADARRLRAALMALPAAQRDVVELAFFAGLTHGEISDRTGTPLGTVKGRLRLALRRLRGDLRDLAPALPVTGSPRTETA